MEAPATIQGPEGSCARRIAALHVALIAAVVVLAGVPSLFTRDLWAGDETRFLEVAREMVLSRDFMVPHFNGNPVSERPPLAFWPAAFLWKAGLGYNSGRVLALLAVLATLVVVYLRTASLVSRKAGLLAAGVTLTSLGVFWQVRQGVPDSLLMFLATLALLQGHSAMHSRGRAARLNWLCCYAALGLCALTDGLLGALLPCVGLLAYALLSRRKIRSGGAFHLLGLAAFAAIVLAWLMSVPQASGYSPTVALFQSLNEIMRSVRQANPLRGVLQVLLQFIPWVVILPVAIVAAVRERRRLSLPVFATVGMLAPVLVLSLLCGDALSCLLLIAPAVGILCGCAIASPLGSENRSIRSERWLTGAPLIVMLVLLGGVLSIGILHLFDVSYLLVGKHHVCPVTDQPYSVGQLAGAMLLSAPSLGVILIALFASPSKRARRAPMLVVAILLLGLPLDLFAVPFVNGFRSGRGFARQVASQVGQTAAVYQYRDDYDGTYNLYTGRVPMPVVYTKGKLGELLKQHDTFVIADEKRLGKVLGPEVWEPHVAAQGRVGRRFMLLLEGGR